MTHVLILGITLSGKTTCAKRLAAAYKSANVGVIVFDPMHDPAWQCDFRTADQEEFLDVLWRSKSCMVFIDESGKAVGRYNNLMNETATMGRHWGHTLHYCTQRAPQIEPLVRDQCTRLFLFASSKPQGKLLAEEWNHADLETCNLLKTGEHYYAVKMGVCERRNLFSRSNQNADSIDPDGVSNHGDRGEPGRPAPEAPEDGGTKR